MAGVDNPVELEVVVGLDEQFSLSDISESWVYDVKLVGELVAGYTWPSHLVDDVHCTCSGNHSVMEIAFYRELG